MSVRDFQAQQLLEFGGSMSALDAPDVPLPKALAATNVVFPEGAVASRTGFGQAYAANEPATSLYHWRSSLGSFLLWYNTQVATGTAGSAANNVRYIDLAASSPSTATLIAGSLVGAAASFANAGSRLYCTTFTTAGRGATPARVVSYQSAAFVSDFAFQGPIAYAPSAPTEPLAGLVTAGLHRLAYRIEYRSGFVSRPSPDNGVAATPSVTTFQPISFTAVGSKNLSWTLNTTWPTGAVAIWILMTPVSNPNRWMTVPGARYAVTGGSLQSVTATISISDDDLIATGIDDTQSQLLWTYSANGATAPFNPSLCFTHGDRMVYLTTISDGLSNQISTAVVSNPNAYQEVTQDQHIIPLPGNQDIMSGFSLDGVLYLLGPNYTYATDDNGAEPVTWAQPRMVDGRRGTLAPRGVEVSPAGTYAWVAHQTGLYYFQGGQYSNLPISYFNAEWQRINWAAAWCIEIKDNPEDRTVYVKVPLDGATVPTHLLSWDYTAGFTSSAANFSLIELPQYGIGAMEIVQNDRPSQATGVAKRMELWCAPGMNVNWVLDPSFNRSVMWYVNALWSVATDANARTGTKCGRRVANGSTVATDILDLGAEYGCYAGQALTAEVWAKSSGANGTLTLTINFWNSSNVYVGNIASSALSPTATYSLMRASGVAPAGAVYCRLTCVDANHTAGTWYVDDAAVYSGGILRQLSPNDTNPYRDNGYAVVPDYETGLLPPKDSGPQMCQHDALGMRVKGAGHLSVIAEGLDGRIARNLLRTEINTAPGREYLRKFSLRSEQIGYRFAMNLVPNGSFESDTLVWTATGAWAVQNDPGGARRGRRYAKHTGAATNDQMLILDDANRVPVTAGDVYYWEAWGKSDGTADGVCIVGLDFFNVAGAAVKYALFTLSDATSWTRMCNIVTVPAGAVTMGFEIAAQNKTTGSWYVDGMYACKLDSYFLLSSLKHYYSPYIGAR